MAYFEVKIIQEELTGRNLPERILMIIPVPYYIISIILSLILILIYEIIGREVMLLDNVLNKFSSNPGWWESYQIDSLALSISIGFLLFGIHFFLNKMRNTFEELGDSFENKDLGYDLRNQIQRNFSNSKLYYLIVLFVILPFLMSQIRAFLLKGKDTFYYGMEPSYWTFMLDLCNNFLNYTSLYLLGAILWLIVNISWSLDIINSSPYKNNLKVNLFKADRMGGLKPLRDLILSFSIYYFILIILFIMSWLIPYVDPQSGSYSYKLMPFESIFLVIFWIIGVAFFVWGWYAIRKILLGKFEGEINNISDLCRYKTQQLSDLVSKDDSSEIEKHLNQISNALDALHKERERMLEIGARPMDIKTILLFLGSSISSMIAIMKTLEEAKMEIIGPAINYLQYIINNLINYKYV